MEKAQSIYNIRNKINKINTPDQVPQYKTVTLNTEWNTLIKLKIDNGILNFIHKIRLHTYLR